MKADDLAGTVDEAIAQRHTPVGTAVAERVKAATETDYGNVLTLEIDAVYKPIVEIVRRAYA